MNNIRKVLFIMLLLITYLNSYSQKEEHKRWSIKTLSDKDTTLVHFKKVINSSVHEQVNIKRPVGMLTKRDATETTVYSLDCYILGFKSQKDTDIHVIIKDTKTNETMVAEIVDNTSPIIKHTSRHKELKKIRKWFLKHIGNPKQSFTMFKTPKLVTITGVGFWDVEHGQKGMAANGREIHPILSMKFKE